MSFFTTTSLLLSSFLMQTLAMPVAVPNPSDLISLSERATVEVVERATAVIERQPETQPKAATPIELTSRAPAPAETLPAGTEINTDWHAEDAVYQVGGGSGGICAVM